MRTHATHGSTRNRVTSKCPLCDAKCHGVPPPLSGLLKASNWTEQLAQTHFLKQSAKGPSHPYPGLLDLRNAQQGSAQFRHVRSAMPDAKGSIHPWVGLSDLRHAQQGNAQFRHVHSATTDRKHPSPAVTQRICTMLTN